MYKSSSSRTCVYINHLDLVVSISLDCTAFTIIRHVTQTQSVFLPRFSMYWKVESLHSCLNMCQTQTWERSRSKIAYTRKCW
ncbi:hypothetical protein ES332_A09G011800v1 [Gossypium tomentosum]|uniref:Uncharacterized protein n=1 Tax=Gossypium tomentosum TaxID=34277 RepID=A0A5D2NX11_GOSTO|nr:hypothetical protein ES332_A09G011800v1 [Gossypium tomentosum]